MPCSIYSRGTIGSRGCGLRVLEQQESVGFEGLGDLGLQGSRFLGMRYTAMNTSAKRVRVFVAQGLGV